MPSNFQPPASHTVTESMNVHAGETVRITVRNSGATFYVTANGDEFLPFHTFSGIRDRIQCCQCSHGNRAEIIWVLIENS